MSRFTCVYCGTERTSHNGTGSDISCCGEVGHVEEVEMSRPISVIASDIRKDWGAKVNYAAKPYLDAMFSLESIEDAYYQDSGRSVVLYFLSNATSWRGDKAREIKAELKALIGK
jgi:hypothetical protein